MAEGEEGEVEEELICQCGGYMTKRKENENEILYKCILCGRPEKVLKK
jgi:hypothetical protein